MVTDRSTGGRAGAARIGAATRGQADLGVERRARTAAVGHHPTSTQKKETWQALTDMHPDTGLVPILLGFLDGGHEGRPSDDGELGPRARPDGGRPAGCRHGARTGVGGLQYPPRPNWRIPEWAAMVAPYGEPFPGLSR